MTQYSKSVLRKIVMLLKSITSYCKLSSAKNCCRKDKCLHRADDGSGTMLGIGLIIVVCSMLILSVNIGYVLVEKHRVHAVASSAALSGARVLQKMDGNNECAIAQSIISANGITMESCKSENDDVTLKVNLQTRIPFIPKIVETVKAGLISCDE